MLGVDEDFRREYVLRDAVMAPVIGTRRSLTTGGCDREVAELESPEGGRT